MMSSNRKPLTHKRVAIAGGRRFSELDSLVSKLGGQALARPMMSSEANDKPDLAAAIRSFAAAPCDWVIVVTGVGTRALLAKAEALGVGEAVQGHLERCQVAARGYKTLKALKELGISPSVTDADGTVEGLRRELEPHDFQGKRVAVQLHGERMPELTEWLVSAGADVLEIPLYFYDPPPVKEVQRLLYEVLSADVDAVAFTSNTQVKFFFAGAAELRAEAALLRALNERVLALSVGSVTSEALSERGVTRIIAPERERMGAMIMALAAHYEGVPTSFPVLLTGIRRAVVIGGGQVAERKVRSLLESGVSPTIISPELTKGLQEMVAQGLKHRSNPYRASDLNAADLVIAATNSAEVNAEVAARARQLGALCNVVNAPELGNFTTLGTVRRGDLTLALATSGKSPALNRYLSERLSEQFPGGYAELLEVLSDHRVALNTLSHTRRTDLLDKLTEEVVSGSAERLRERLEEMIEESGAVSGVSGG